MKKELTKRQAMILLFICFVANKAQRLPSFIATNMGRHGWLVTLILGLIDVLMLFIMLWTNHTANGRTCYDMCKNAGGKCFAKFIVFFFSLYYILNALLPYEAIHDVFSNVLFDHLSWELYSFFIVFALAFLATHGLKTIGRVSELLVWIIGAGLIGILILGATTTDFLRVLPIYDIDAGKLFETCFSYSVWFGDFTIVYIFMGRVKEDDGRMNFWFPVVLMISVLVMSFGYTVYYGLYDVLAPEQTNAISSISQFALLNLDIGRVDWFLVLFFELSTFISSGLYIFGASKCLCQVFEIKHQKVVTIVLPIIIYLFDIFVFKSVGRGASKLARYVKYFFPVVAIGFPIVLLIASFVSRKKDRKKVQQYKNYETLYSHNKVGISKNVLSVAKKNMQLRKELTFCESNMQGGKRPCKK